MGAVIVGIRLGIAAYGKEGLHVFGLDLNENFEVITVVAVGDGGGGARGEDSAREARRCLRRTRGRLALIGEMLSVRSTGCSSRWQ